MTLNYATAETGGNGSNVSTSDAGTPAWTTVTVGAGGTLTYSNTGGCKRDTLCYSYSSGGTAVNAFMAWTVNGGASTATQFFRWYIDPSDFTGSPVLMRAMDSGGVNQFIPSSATLQAFGLPHPHLPTPPSQSRIEEFCAL